MKTSDKNKNKSKKKPTVLIITVSIALIVFIGIAFTFDFLRSENNKPKAEDIRSGLLAWQNGNKHGGVFDSKSPISVTKCVSLTSDNFDVLNHFLNISKSDQSKMDDMGYACDVQIITYSNIPLFVVKRKDTNAWIAVPVRFPDDKYHIAYKSLFDINY
jgi:hypothetical protein